MSRSRDIFGIRTSGFLTVVLVNAALVIALGFGLQQVRLETEREARAEAALAETRNLVGLCQHAAMVMLRFSTFANLIFLESYQQDAVQIRLSLQRLESLVSDNSEQSVVMVPVRTLVDQELRLLNETSVVCGFRARWLYKQTKRFDSGLQDGIRQLRLDERVAKSHRARDIASEFVRLTLTFAVLFNGTMALRSVSAVIRPRPLFPLALFR